MVAPARTLSGGQQHRLALAVALGEARRRQAPALLVADEFASSLDRLTALILCRQMRKVATAWNLAMLIATPRVALLGALAPDTTVVKPLGCPPRIIRGEARADSKHTAWTRFDPKRWPVIQASMEAYEKLGRFHYLAGPPAAHKRVYAIRTPRHCQAVGGPELAAVLVVSPPLVSVRGRNLATAGRYAGPDRAAALALLNREMEWISRVIVHPVFRGSGLAVRIVRHALRTAHSPWIEALAVMGAVHPFFVKAGMQALPVGPDEDAARLLSAAEAVGLSAEDVAAVEPLRRFLRRRSAAARFLRREVDRLLHHQAVATPTELRKRRRSRSDAALAELCRRTARPYVYYLARTQKESPSCPHATAARARAKKSH